MAIRSKKNKQGKLEIDLTGPQGNAYFLLGTADRLARRLGKDAKAICDEMKSGDYDNLIQVFDREFGDVVDLYK